MLAPGERTADGSASGIAATDIGTGSTTSVQNILASATNVASEALSGFTNFFFTGPGFSDTNGSNVVKVSVNLSGVTDATTLAAALNQAIQNAGKSAYYTVKQAAWILGVTPSKVSRAIRTGTLRAERRGARLVIPANELSRLLAEQDTNGANGDHAGGASC